MSDPKCFQDEHILIDALTYRGARVKCHHGITDAYEMWLVVKHNPDKPLSAAIIKKLQMAWRLMLDGIDEELDGLAAPEPTAASSPPAEETLPDEPTNEGEM